jgi:hypothetical protein
MRPATARQRPWIFTALAALMVVSASPIGFFASQSHAAENLECPEVGAGRVPDLIGDAAGGGLFITASRTDLANEINDGITGYKSVTPISRGPTFGTC